MSAWPSFLALYQSIMLRELNAEFFLALQGTRRCPPSDQPTCQARNCTWVLPGTNRAMADQATMQPARCAMPLPAPFLEDAGERGKLL